MQRRDSHTGSPRCTHFSPESLAEFKLKAPLLVPCSSLLEASKSSPHPELEDGQRSNEEVVSNLSVRPLAALTAQIAGCIPGVSDSA